MLFSGPPPSSEAPQSMTYWNEWISTICAGEGLSVIRSWMEILLKVRFQSRHYRNGVTRRCHGSRGTQLALARPVQAGQGTEGCRCGDSCIWGSGRGTFRNPFHQGHTAERSNHGQLLHAVIFKSGEYYNIAYLYIQLCCYSCGDAISQHCHTFQFCRNLRDLSQFRPKCGQSF